MHFSWSHSFYTKEFDVNTCLIDLIEYNMCSLDSFKFLKRNETFILSMRHFNSNNFNKRRKRVKHKKSKEK